MAVPGGSVGENCRTPRATGKGTTTKTSQTLTLSSTINADLKGFHFAFYPETTMVGPTAPSSTANASASPATTITSPVDLTPWLSLDRWAPATWLVGHAYTLKYPWRPTPLQEQEAREFFNQWFPVLIRCDTCRTHYQQHLSTAPPPTQDREKLAAWLIDLHNRVNALNRKALWSYEAVAARYYGPSWRAIFQHEQQQAQVAMASQSTPQHLGLIHSETLDLVTALHRQAPYLTVMTETNVWGPVPPPASLDHRIRYYIRHRPLVAAAGALGALLLLVVIVGGATLWSQQRPPASVSRPPLPTTTVPADAASRFLV